MFYLTTHSTHFICGFYGVIHMVKVHSRRKEGNVLFNDALNTFYLRFLWRQTYGKGPFRKEGLVLFNNALNTFYLRFYGVRHMVKNHSVRKEGNVLFNDALNTFYLRFLWRQTYGKGPFRKEGRIGFI